jgi:hypothetical protein
MVPSGNRAVTLGSGAHAMGQLQPQSRRFHWRPSPAGGRPILPGVFDERLVGRGYQDREDDVAERRDRDGDRRGARRRRHARRGAGEDPPPRSQARRAGAGESAPTCRRRQAGAQGPAAERGETGPRERGKLPCRAAFEAGDERPEADLGTRPVPVPLADRQSPRSAGTFLRGRNGRRLVLVPRSRGDSLYRDDAAETRGDAGARAAACRDGRTCALLIEREPWDGQGGAKSVGGRRLSDSRGSLHVFCHLHGRVGLSLLVRHRQAAVAIDVTTVRT